MNDEGVSSEALAFFTSPRSRPILALMRSRVYILCLFVLGAFVSAPVSAEPPAPEKDKATETKPATEKSTKTPPKEDTDAAKKKAAAKKAAAEAKKKAAAEKAATEKAAAEKAAAQKAAAEKAAAEKAAAEKASAEKAADAKAAAEKADEEAKKKAAAEKAAAEKAAAEKAAAEKASAEKAAAEKADEEAKKKAAAEKAAAEKAAAEKAAAEKAAAEKAAAEKASTEEATAEKAAADKADEEAKKKAAAEAKKKAAADKADADKAAAKRAAAQKRADERARQKTERAAKRKAAAEAKRQARADRIAAREETRRQRAEERARTAAEAHATAVSNASNIVLQTLQPISDALILKQLVKTRKHIALEALHNTLQHEDERVRRMAATALNTIRDPSSIPLLIKRLSDSDPRVVITSAHTLGAVLGERAVILLANLSGHYSVHVRCEAMEALANTGSAKARRALNEWRDVELAAEERSCVLGALMTMGETNTLDEAIDLLVQPGGADFATHVLARGGVASLHALGARLKQKAPVALVDLSLSIAAMNGRAGIQWVAALVSYPQQHVRRSALHWLLERAAERAVVPLLLKTTRKADKASRSRIIRELAHRKVTGLLPLARRWLDDPDPNIRAACALAFREMPKRTDRDRLIRQLQTERMNVSVENLDVRRTILEAMTRHEDSDLVPVFVNAVGYKGEEEIAVNGLVALGKPALRTLLLALKIGDELRTPYVAEAMARIGEGIGPTVAELLRHKREAIRILARELLTASGDPAAIRHLVKQLRDKRFKEPFVIIEALSYFSSPEATDALIETTLHDDSDIRVAAIQALGKTHDRRSSTIAALVRIVEEDAESNVRSEAVKTLFQLGAKGLVRLLGRLIQYDDPDVRTMAYHAFANMGDPHAIKPLANQLSTVRGKERTAVLRALRRITRDRRLRSRGDYLAWYSLWKETQTNAHKGFRKGTFKANGKKMSYRIAGQGPTVIALSSRRGGAIWGATLRHLAASHRVVTYDAPGRGASKSRAGGFTLASELAVIDALRKHVRAQKVVIIADEVGALLAAQYAITHPKQVRSLVLITPTLTGSRGTRDHIAAQKLNKTALKQLGRLDEQYGWFHPAAWTLYRNAVLNLGYVRKKTLASRLEAFPITAYTDQRLARMMRGLKLADQLRRVRAKVLIVRGEHDALSTQEAHALSRIARQHNHVSIQRIKGVGHYPQLESPQKLARTIRPFLAKKHVQ